MSHTHTNITFSLNTKSTLRWRNKRENSKSRKRKRNIQGIQQSALTTIPTTMLLNIPSCRPKATMSSRPTATTSSRPTATVCSTSKVHLEAFHYSQVKITLPPALQSYSNSYIHLYNYQLLIISQVLERYSQYYKPPQSSTDQIE